jgi:hypothetical protein
VNPLLLPLSGLLHPNLRAICIDLPGHVLRPCSAVQYQYALFMPCRAMQIRSMYALQAAMCH